MQQVDSDGQTIRRRQHAVQEATTAGIHPTIPVRPEKIPSGGRLWRSRIPVGLPTLADSSDAESCSMQAQNGGKIDERETYVETEIA